MNLMSLFSSLGIWNWLIAACLLFGLEILLPGFYLMFFGISALIVGGVSFGLEISWQVQFLLFGAVSLALVYAARYLGFGQNIESDKPFLNQRAQQHIGKTYIVTEPILQGAGKIKVGDSVWRVSGPDAPKGSKVKVIGADGVTLLVEPESNE